MLGRQILNDLMQYLSVVSLRKLATLFHELLASNLNRYFLSWLKIVAHIYDRENRVVIFQRKQHLHVLQISAEYDEHLDQLCLYESRFHKIFQIVLVFYVQH